ncbi:hypothetical protein B9Z55_015605 [Caenorhabditis nigoni]|uniref:Uncharacterized protein n=1 Tax=Caenorhabditis nigoni TaxID=1611254 RepID=A0A2G5UB00_9PELO|nr:hypothetical protein B9Z55_015605 [Caenorhabditis nigoni]
MSESSNFEERLLNSYRDVLFKFKAENSGPESPWGDLSQILLEAIGKNHEMEKLKIELQQEKVRNLEITTSFEKQLALKDAQIADLLQILQSNHSYQENLKLKDTISELETDLKQYKEKNGYRKTGKRMEKFKLKGPEFKSDNVDKQEKSKNLDITTSVKKHEILKSNHLKYPISDLGTDLKWYEEKNDHEKIEKLFEHFKVGPNHSYQENLKLKDKISDLGIDLKWYEEKDEYGNIKEAKVASPMTTTELLVHHLKKIRKNQRDNGNGKSD